MRSPRLLLFLIGLAIILGLMVWLVLSLTQLYATIAQMSAPWVGTLMIIVLAALLLALIGVLLYFAILFWRGDRNKTTPLPPPAPDTKTEAAAETLRSIRRQVDQIQDEVARQALLVRSCSIETQFDRTHYRVVVFGTGSAGKTSLVNALLGRAVGATSPIMGTTTIGETYVLSLAGLDREIWLTDTPGLLEVGVAGTQREREARQLATEADLLLFLVEGDITQSEYQALRSLAAIGKRLLLVFNKTDRYPAPDREQVLAALGKRVRDQIAPADILAIAAAPQTVTLPSGDRFTPDPDLQALLPRIVAILHQEGEELQADNILLQSKRLGDEARQALADQRQKAADKIVDRFQWIGAGVIWVTPIPVVDLLAAAAVNAQMVVEIGQVYGCELTFDRGRDLALSLVKTLAGLGIIRGVIEVVTVSLELTVGGYLIGKSIQSISAAYLTRIAGKSFIEYFSRDQDWGDGGITEVVQRQYQLNRRDEFVKAFIQEAIAKLPEHLGQLMQGKNNDSTPPSSSF